MLMLAHSPFQVSAVQHEADDLSRHGQPAYFVRKEQLPAEVGSSTFAAGMVLERTGVCTQDDFMRTWPVEQWPRGSDP